MTAPPTTLVSMSEIMRVGPWALRALGYPFGVAERATPLLAWTEAAVGSGLALLRIGETALRASVERPPAVQTRKAAGERVLNASGRSLFELGPPAIDLLTADLRLHGAACLTLRGAIGATLIPSLTNLMARRGHGALVIHATAPGEIAVADAPRMGWHLAVQTTSGPCFLSGDLEDGAFARRHADASILFDSDRLSGLCDAMASAPDGFIGMLGIAAFAPPGLIDAPAAVDRAGRVARAYGEGLSVATEDLEHLYALERITWAPTSERSRKQAGY
jgi:hypothetical protein